MEVSKGKVILLGNMDRVEDGVRYTSRMARVRRMVNCSRVGLE